MKIFLSFLKYRSKYIIIYFVFGLIFVSSFLLYRIPVLTVIYPFLLCTVFGIIVLLCDFFKVKNTHAELENIQKSIKKTLDYLPSPETVSEEDYRNIIYELKEFAKDVQEEDETKYRETVDYFTVWAHEIKTPIAASKLKLQSEDSPLSRQLRNELGKIERYVNMVLTFIRLDSSSTDFVFAKYDLDALLKECIKKFAGEFIDRKLKLDFKETNLTVLTDEKWLSFVLEQIISNALKYTGSGTISIFAENSILYIKDTGIGIAPEDLPRIFEKGYTGFNGRNDKKASGIGLFLSKRICDNLGHKIAVSSVLNEGTAVQIDLSVKKLNIE